MSDRASRLQRVSETTISRDLGKLLPLVRECPTCHGLTPRAWWRDEEE
jgi:hypothetical protein